MSLIRTSDGANPYTIKLPTPSARDPNHAHDYHRLYNPNHLAEPCARANGYACHVGCGAAFGAKHIRCSSLTFGTSEITEAKHGNPISPNRNICFTSDYRDGRQEPHNESQKIKPCR